ncbi:MAG: RtcB family protein [Acidimicrobiales bacterium]
MPTTINPKLISWASDIDPSTIRQAEKTARLPIVEGHVALMPDAHVGLGATVGSVIPTNGAVIPAAVGVDIGCGMIAAELDLTAAQLPDSLDPLLGRIARPCRRASARAADVSRAADRFLTTHRPATELTGKLAMKAAKQFGNLGSGNHFFELCLDGATTCGSCSTRGAGASATCSPRCIGRARGLAKAMELRLEDRDLAYFLEGTEPFQAYIADMLWAQDYARANRDQMMDRAMREVLSFVGTGREVQRINCHHNFTQREGTVAVGSGSPGRGAIKADVDDLGVIPGSMGTRSTSCGGRDRPRVGRRARTAPVVGTPGPPPRSCTTPTTSPRRWRARSGRPTRPPSSSTDPGGLQGHRPGDGRPGRPRRRPPRAPPGPQLQGHLTGRSWGRADAFLVHFLDTCVREVHRVRRGVRAAVAQRLHYH